MNRSVYISRGLSQAAVRFGVSTGFLLPPTPVPRPAGLLFQTQQHRNFLKGIRDKIFSKKAAPRPTEEELAAMSPSELHNLGAKYFSGSEPDGIRLDGGYAVHLFRLARSKGGLHSTYALAMMRLPDSPARDFVRDDEEDPIRTLQQLAENGFTQAQFNLGLFHFMGRYGVMKDLSLAQAWFEKAAAQGDIQAPFNLYLILQKRGNLNEAMDWLKTAVEREDLNAAYILGNWYNQGNTFLPKDQAKAVQIWTEAAEKGHANAAHNAGMAFLQGVGVEQSGDRALRLLRQASDQGFLPAKLNLAQLYLEGLVVPKDVPTARILLVDIVGSVGGQAGSEPLREQARTLLKEIDIKHNGAGY